MIIQFENPMNEATRQLMNDLFKDRVAAMDDKTALINACEFTALDMKKLANAAGQPAELHIHEEGEIKTMSDDTQYRVDPKGWRHLTP